MKVSMLLLASGRGTRLGGSLPKAFVACRGRSLLERSAARLAEVLGPAEREIILAVDPQDRAAHVEPMLESLRACGVTLVVDGGATRQESMQRAFAASSADCEVVLVHDAARPFFPLAAAREVVLRAREVGAALLAMPAPDTIKRTDRQGRVIETVDRRGLWLAQTPQAARRELLERAISSAERAGFSGTDDVSLLERSGVTVEVVPGSPFNIKITTPDDLALAELIAAREEPTRAEENA